MHYGRGSSKICILCILHEHTGSTDNTGQQNFTFLCHTRKRFIFGVNRARGVRISTQNFWIGSSFRDVAINPIFGTFFIQLCKMLPDNGAMPAKIFILFIFDNVYWTMTWCMGLGLNYCSSGLVDFWPVKPTFLYTIVQMVLITIRVA